MALPIRNIDAGFCPSREAELLCPVGTAGEVWSLEQRMMCLDRL